MTVRQTDADAAEDARAAERDAGDREQREVASPGRSRRSLTRGRSVEQPARPARDAGDDERDDDDAVDLEAGQPGRVAVAADAVEVAAEDGVGEHELDHDRDDERR